MSAPSPRDLPPWWGYRNPARIYLPGTSTREDCERVWAAFLRHRVEYQHDLELDSPEAANRSDVRLVDLGIARRMLDVCIAVGYAPRCIVLSSLGNLAEFVFQHPEVEGANPHALVCICPEYIQVHKYMREDLNGIYRFRRGDGIESIMCDALGIAAMIVNERDAA